MDTTQLLHIKAQLICDLRTYLRRPTVRAEIEGIDARLWQYLTDATAPLEHYVLQLPPSDSAQDDEECVDIEDCIASLHELLCIRKSLRKWRTYTLDTDYALRWLRAIEGVWTQREDGAWQHVSGGVKFDTPQGARHVRLMPFQVWFVVTTMLFQTEVDMEREYHEGDPLLPSEFVREVDDDPLPL